MFIPQKIKLENATYIKVDDETIGEGSYGVVWKMKRVSDNTIVAVKAIQKNNYPHLEEKARDALKKEINFLNKLKDSKKNFVLPLLDHGIIDKDPFIVMPLADYCLDDIHKNSLPFTPEQLFKWTIQVTTGLQYIHSTKDETGKPYLYRDFKPSNVLIMNDNAYLCDFGSIKPKNDDDLTTSHMFTPKFIAPENAIPKVFEKSEGLFLYDSRSDVFSLGVSLYYIITNYSQLGYKNDLKEHVDLHNYTPYKGLEKQYGKIGGLLPEEIKILKEYCKNLFGIIENNERTNLGFPAVMLPDKNDIAEKLVVLISNMISPIITNRPDTNKIIQIVTKLRENYFPKLLSFKIKAPKYIETGDPIELLICAEGKGLLSDGSWLHITLQRKKSNQPIAAEPVENEQKQQWKAVLNQTIEPGIYTLNVAAYINDKEIFRQKKIEVLPSHLNVEANEYTELGKPIEAQITLTEKTNRKNLSSWFYVIIHNSNIKKKANSVIWDNKTNQWKATFASQLPLGLYTITVILKYCAKYYFFVLSS